MPFKFGLRKTRHYNVLSRNVLVVSVELIDKTTLECTLSTSSSGLDCLHNVCQRLNLQQPEFFGLRYMSKKPYPKIRWLELDRPLKKQLDKYAQSSALSLAVQYYIHDVGLLQDDVTRSHHFLQIKQDVLEGKLRCDYEQAILLASYSLQAEFGDHQTGRHTPEYLKDFRLFPKQAVGETEVGSLLEAVVWQYSSLAGLAQSLAETYYIIEAQRLPGYGQETFLVKDEKGSEAYLGPSLLGIVIESASGSFQKFYRWNDIMNLINQKKSFGIQMSRTQEIIHFFSEEHDAAKYVWKMCAKQHTFYKENQDVLEVGGMEARSLAIPDLQSSVSTSMQSNLNSTLNSTALKGNETFFNETNNSRYGHSDFSTSYLSKQVDMSRSALDSSIYPHSTFNVSTLQYNINQPVTPLPQTLRFSLKNKPENLPPSGYGAAKSGGRTGLSQPCTGKLQPTNTLLSAPQKANVVAQTSSALSRTNLINQQPYVSQQAGKQVVNVPNSQNSMFQYPTTGATQLSNVTQTPAQNHPKSELNSQNVDASRLNRVIPNSFNSSLRASSRKRNLPQYRAAPDYETAVVKYGDDFNPSFRTALLYSSQPEISKHQTQEFSLTANQFNINDHLNCHYLDHSHQQNFLSPHLYAGRTLLHNTYSTPELNRELLEREEPNEYHFMHGRGPPPPYPYSKPSSNSTPDLATAAKNDQGSNSNNSNRKRLSLMTASLGCLGSPELSRTYENLSDLTEVVDSLRNELNKNENVTSYGLSVEQQNTGQGDIKIIPQNFSHQGYLSQKNTAATFGGVKCPEVPSIQKRNQQVNEQTFEPIYQNVNSLLSGLKNNEQRCRTKSVPELDLISTLPQPQLKIFHSNSARQPQIRTPLQPVYLAHSNLETNKMLLQQKKVQIEHLHQQYAPCGLPPLTHGLSPSVVPSVQVPFRINTSPSTNASFPPPSYVAKSHIPPQGMIQTALSKSQAIDHQPNTSQIQQNVQIPKTLLQTSPVQKNPQNFQIQHQNFKFQQNIQNQQKLQLQQQNIPFSQPIFQSQHEQNDPQTQQSVQIQPQSAKIQPQNIQIQQQNSQFQQQNSQIQQQKPQSIQIQQQGSQIQQQKPQSIQIQQQKPQSIQIQQGSQIQQQNSQIQQHKLQNHQIQQQNFPIQQQNSQFLQAHPETQQKITHIQQSNQNYQQNQQFHQNNPHSPQVLNQALPTHENKSDSTIVYKHVAQYCLPAKQLKLQSTSDLNTHQQLKPQSTANFNTQQQLKLQSTADLNTQQQFKPQITTNLNTQQQLKLQSNANLNKQQQLKQQADLNTQHQLKFQSPADLNTQHQLKFQSPADLNAQQQLKSQSFAYLNTQQHSSQVPVNSRPKTSYSIISSNKPTQPIASTSKIDVVPDKSNHVYYGHATVPQSPSVVQHISNDIEYVKVQNIQEINVKSPQTEVQIEAITKPSRNLESKDKIEDIKTTPKVEDRKVTSIFGNLKVTPKFGDLALMPKFGDLKFTPKFGDKKVTPKFEDSKVTSKSNLQVQKIIESQPSSSRFEFTPKSSPKSTSRLGLGESPIPKCDTKIAELEQKLLSGNLATEFISIPDGKPHPDFSPAELPENLPRNRYKDILPYNENRVKITPSKNNKTGYINASHLTASVGENQRFYICAQGPMASTVSHFWQCVWECDVRLIVMLTSVEGDTSTSKSFPYWPQTSGTSVECEQYRIYCKQSTQNDSHVTSRLQLVSTNQRSARVVWHLQYIDWADHGCPGDIGSFLSFLDELSLLRSLTYDEVRGVGQNRNTPILVHCSAGVGRTGVAVMCDLLLETSRHNLPMDPPKVLSQLRQQRMALVQSLEQYRFIYEVLIASVQNSRLI